MKLIDTEDEDFARFQRELVREEKRSGKRREIESQFGTGKRIAS
jgi:hypothetical protein